MGKRIESPHFIVQPRGGLSAMGQAAQRKPDEKAKTPRRQKPLPKPSKPLPKKAKKKRIITNGKVVRGHKLRPLVEDPQYIEDLRDEACEFTGLYATEDDPVEPMHIGNIGKGIKSANEALPALHSIHSLTHTKEGLKAILPYLERNPSLLIDMLRAYARERYAIAKAEQEPMDTTGEQE